MKRIFILPNKERTKLPCVSELQQFEFKRDPTKYRINWYPSPKKRNKKSTGLDEYNRIISINIKTRIARYLCPRLSSTDYRYKGFNEVTKKYRTNTYTYDDKHRTITVLSTSISRNSVYKAASSVTLYFNEKYEFIGSDDGISKSRYHYTNSIIFGYHSSIFERRSIEIINKLTRISYGN